MRRIDQKIAYLLIAVVFLAVGLTSAFSYAKKVKKDTSVLVQEIKEQDLAESLKEDVQPILEASDQIAEKIAAEPPKRKELQKTSTTTANGIQTVTISGGDVSQSDLDKMNNAAPNGSSPYDVPFVDMTGRYASLEKVLKDYVNVKLRWGNEIGSLYQIVVKDAGDTGWSGQYVGSYKIKSTGDIVSASGIIILNSSYYQKYSTEDFNEYMKWIISHEYGHHYTLYHKWVDLDLPMGTRFPDAYYTARPLSKDNTSVDCSSDWQSCESEIIAEDYSYFYSGFRQHQMKATYGLPAAAAKTWMDGLATSSTQPTTDNPPQVSVLSPAASTILTNNVEFSANPSDDHGVAKVRFYINQELLHENAAAPWKISFDTNSYSNGQYILKTIAFDASGQSAESSVTITIKNQMKVTIQKPTPSPYTWTGAEPTLTVEIRTTPNVPANKLMVYIDDNFIQQIDGANANATWPYDSIAVGQHTLKIEAFDTENNKSEASLVVVKQ